MWEVCLGDGWGGGDVRVLASLILGFPSSMDGTGGRARYELPSVDGGFFRTSDLHRSARVRSLMARTLCLVSSSEIQGGVVYRQKKRGRKHAVSPQCEVRLKMATAEPA